MLWADLLLCFVRLVDARTASCELAATRLAKDAFGWNPLLVEGWG